MGTFVTNRKIGERLLLSVGEEEIEIMVFDSGEGKADIAIKASQKVKISKLPTHIAEEKHGRKPEYIERQSRKSRRFSR